MSSKWTKLAGAAAALAVVVTLSLTALHQSATPAYAIEQTRQANRGLRYIHVRIDPANQGISEAWVQLDPQGEFLHVRMDAEDTPDGPKAAVWQADKIDVWFKAKNILLTTYDTGEVARFPALLKVFDPKAVVDTLYEAQAAGKVSVETRMPSAPGGPIVLVSTSRPTPERQVVYRIDPVTKLVQRVEKYALESGQYKLQSAWDYLEYNQSPDPSVFALNPPTSVTRIDQTTQAIGLPKGDLSDAQITVQVVRTFFEALMARDYAQAGRMLSGLPAAELEKMFGSAKVVRIVSLSEPIPQPIPGVGGMVVSCSVEIEVNGTTMIEEFKPCVRPVHGQPDRWEISGGI